MLDAIRGFFNFIPGLGSVKAAPTRQPSRSASTFHSRNNLQGISQPVNVNGQEAISLPVGAQEFKKVLDYMTEMKKKLFGLGRIPPEIRAIAQKMASVSEEVANKMGVPKERLIELGNKFQEDIGPMALIKFQGSLTKVINFYAQSFNMSEEAMALA
ncbi:MAG: hypothetical protein VKK32_02640 [Candidatus Melainabacteria bacterium]|nr:hypothetical protein [Candidatus Melainabacteria bacterium]